MLKSLKKKARQEKIKDRLGISHKYSNYKNMLVSGSVVLSGVLVRKAAEYLWKATTHREPPKNPADRDVSWADALAWTLITGITISLVRLIIRRNVDVGVEEST